jgi:hypothetical protein
MERQLNSGYIWLGQVKIHVSSGYDKLCLVRLCCGRIGQSMPSFERLGPVRAGYARLNLVKPG